MHSAIDATLRGARSWSIITLLMAASFARAAEPSAAPTVAQWQRWEAVLTPQKTHARAYADVEVDVQFKGPGGNKGPTFTVPAFWEPERGFVVRAAFPSVGRWEWETRCSERGDAGLHQQRGAVEVSAYSGDNPLWRHGDLRVSENRRYLVHADGTPFLWIGDTAWNAPQKASADEWRDYVDVRVAQRFSVLQVIATGLGPKFGPITGPAAFLPDRTPNPVFWSELDRKVAYANERGLVVLLTGLGRSYAGFSEQQRTRAFSRYVAGRFAAHLVVLSTSMDQKYDLQNDEGGARLRSLTTHLVTQHPGTNYEAARIYHDAGYTDFCGLQTGHHDGKLPRAYDAARNWTLQLWQREPIKPVLNIEAMYDAYGNDSGPNWREQDARKLGWLSWLSGASGYTYGAGDVPPKVKGGSGGIWRFANDTNAYDHWRKAVHWPSATQMTHMRDFFAGIPWWQLSPVPAAVLNQPKDPLQIMAAARTTSADLLVAYLPDNREIVLDGGEMAGPLTAQWFNPMTGKTAPLDMPLPREKTLTLRRPADWQDAVLVIRGAKG